ncbi:acetoacetate--CoA ligase [Ramlibacter rhizophilus]|uniref:Acetoacetate--CoA ligase n=1 Tax=Ramlibacter rhizophilus TaxID=1781167 RepID=A0A4Z0BZT8_9BURK|nr:acetoacetate--CoA ligase [Ramlibacter rhizophilus]TFZ04816.1 acetoacetate--CoA ligase [Ramlibacter rhizophilus]
MDPATAASAPALSQLRAFTQVLSDATGHPFAQHEDLHAWSVAHWREFWRHFAQQHALPLGIAGSLDPVCVGDDIEQARFFPQLRLNYARALLGPAAAPDAAPALRACHADGSVESWSRGELHEQVARLAAALSARGLGEGDRVVALMRNDGGAVIAALAVTALGATLSCASPDMGVDAVLDRFGPLAPRLFIAHTASRPFDSGPPLAEKVDAVARRLPSLAFLLQLDEGPAACTGAWQNLLLADALAKPVEDGQAAWPDFPFEQPLFIMFSSGTTGRPKCIVHGAGGSLLEHLKEHRLHTDLRPGDRLYFHTSCGWMMWNWQLSALASGVEIVTYDGPISSVERLWELVAQERVTVFGTSPAYLRMSEQAGLVPRDRFELGALRLLMSTGAVLHASQFRWVRDSVGPVPVHSISGGTDIIGCFVLGHPELPVADGESPCRSLAMDVQAWKAGRATEGVGELVCATPFPSRPLGFFGDVDGARFHQAYFARHPGVWTHGDLVEITPSGGARMHGRCDGVLNVRGIKFAPQEVIGLLQDIGGVREAMLVERAAGEGETQLLALLVLAPGEALEAARIARLRREIATRLSPAHVPDRFVAVPELPVTHSGKPSEAAARAAVQGEVAGNAGALRNPQCLATIREACERALVHTAADGGDLALRLRALWSELLGVPEIGLDDHFFELGGNSLLAARVLARVREWTGSSLTLGALVQAPTIGELIALLAEGAQVRTQASSLAVCMREGQGAPLFLVHGMSGTAMECWALLRALRTPRPVWGLQARGIDGEEEPQSRVGEMAALYIRQMRRIQAQGPYAVCGFSFGGVVALEIARQLRAAGETLSLVCLLDPHVRQDLGPAARLRQRAVHVTRRLLQLPPRETARRLGRAAQRLVEQVQERAGWRPPRRASEGIDMPPAQARVYDHMSAALAAYRPEAYEGSPVLFVHARVPLEGYFDPMPVWRHVLRGGLRVVVIPGEHMQLVRAQADRVAAVIDEALAPPRGEAADTRSTPQAGAVSSGIRPAA